MRIRLALTVAALAAAALLVRPAAAGTSTPFGGSGIGDSVAQLQTLLDTVYTDEASDEHKALEKALKRFNDPSTKFSEDLTDLRLAIKDLRKVFADGTDVDGILDVAVGAATTIPFGLGTKAYANAPILTRTKALAAYGSASNIENVDKRLVKLAAFCKKLEGYAKSKKINLNIDSD